MYNKVEDCIADVSTSLDYLKLRITESKRKIIGREFIRVFEEAADEIVKSAQKPVGYLVQGTLYPDVVESGEGSATATIKSHHNVGGLPDRFTFKLVEPLRKLFKDEV